MVGAAEPVLAGQSDEQPPLGFLRQNWITRGAIGGSPLLSSPGSTGFQTGSRSLVLWRGFRFDAALVIKL